MTKKIGTKEVRQGETPKSCIMLPISLAAAVGAMAVAGMVLMS